MFLFIFILCFSLLINNASASVIFTLPTDIEVEEVNKNMRKKTMNRNFNVEDQMNHQYKGKLKYKPLKNERKASKKGHFYTSAYFLNTNIEVDKIEDKTTKNTFEMKSGDFKDTYGAEVGIYFKDNMGLSFEYFDYSDDIKTKQNFFIDSRYTAHNKVELHVRNYFLNYFIESNYSRIIPFLGFGVGVVVSDFDNSQLNKNFIGFNTGGYTTDLKKDWTVGYHIFAGIEFSFNESCFIFVRYKYYDIKDKISMEVVNRDNKNAYNFLLEGNSFINLGFKYLW